MTLRVAAGGGVLELVPRRVAEQRWDNIVGERGDINTAGTTDGSKLASSNP